MSYATLLSEVDAAGELPSTGDVLAVGLPLLDQLHAVHAEGMVSRLGGLAHVTYDGGALGFDPMMVQLPKGDGAAVLARNPPASGAGIQVVDRLSIDSGPSGQVQVGSADVLVDLDQRPERPMLVIGYRAWEQQIGHHDQLTDLHLAGQLLASYATGLDLDDEAALATLARSRRHLLRLAPRLHPVVAGVLSDLLEPDRNRRPVDLEGVIARLVNHRDLPADLDLEPAYRRSAGGDWRRAVLEQLRERVFDLTRRNRAVYFRPTASTVGLTEASVPLLLDIDRIRASDLLTWSDDVAGKLLGSRPTDLGTWCRFEEAPHLAPALDKLLAAERRDRAEYGYGRLRLIAAFLRWIDPETGESVDSPLVLLPAELTRKRGVTTRYRLRVETGPDGEAEVNPDLRHLLGARFGITLPETIDANPAAIAELAAELERRVQTTDPGVRIDLVDHPRISLIRRRAQLRLDAYRRRRATALAATGRWRRQDHSYDRADWRPLGLALYRRFVESAPLPLRQLAERPPPPERPSSFAAAAESDATRPDGPDREASLYQVATDVGRHRWEVDLCAVTLASIGSKRTSLVRDYDALLAADVAPHRPFDELFTPEPRPAPPASVPPFGVDQVLVLPADEAQARAVRRAVRGDSFVIQGPPGTGKSQTITNLIGALVADGRRVLFVCEKRAALDVVAHRLDQVGLGDLTVTIHDSQLDRRPFIQQLGRTYRSWLEDAPDTSVADERAAVVARSEAELARLDAVGSRSGLDRR